MSLSSTIEIKLREALAPAHLEVVNESYMHSSGKNNPNAETHFKVVVVSERFEGLSPVKVIQVVRHAPIEIVRVHAFGPAVALLLFDGAAGEGEPRFVEVVALGIESGAPDHDRRMLYQEPVFRRR